MNFYIVVEGKRTEAKVYPEWFKYLLPQHKEVFLPNQLNDNSFCIISGGGRPNYYQIISDSIEDIIANNLNCRLVIIVDSEEETKDIMYADINNKTLSFLNGRTIDYKIVIQCFSIEAWALGNRKIFPRSPNDRDLVKYIKNYNVLKSDPELMPSGPRFDFNFKTRAQFGTEYLKKILIEKNLTYSKSKPFAISSHNYLKKIVERHKYTGHISSFYDLLEAIDAEDIINRR